MKIIKIDKDNKREDIIIIPFLEYYYSKNTEKISFSSVLEGHENRPDYFVDTTKTLIEVKEIHDRTSNQKHAQWGNVVNKLQKATDSNDLLKQVKGTYIVNTPDVFKLHKFDEASSQILQLIIDGVDKQTISVLGINYEVNKVSEQEGIVVYGSIGGAGFIDPANVVFQNIKDKVGVANRQLGFIPKDIKVSKKILLLVNKYYIPLYEWDLFKAISLIYSDLLRYQNIDEIWYQVGTQSGGYNHKLLYSKYFFDKFENENLNSIHDPEYSMFGAWFSSLSEMNEAKKEKLFRALQVLLKTDKPYKIFPNKEHREQMVRLGIWLLENNQIKNAIWLIDQFVDDPDPSSSDEYKGKPEFNYDKIIRDGKDVVVLTTVRGHIAWLIKELAHKSGRHDVQNLINAYWYTKQVITSEKNLYIIQQWLIPLIEIANRRLWLAEDSQETYKNFRNLILNKDDGLIAKYAEYPALAKYLIEILNFFKDLNTGEVQFIIEKIVNSEEGMVLLMYYALYKENHYKKDSDVGSIIEKLDPNILKYNPTFAQNRIKLISLDKANIYAKLRSQLAFQCWRILKDIPTEFDNLESLISNLFNSPYDKNTFSNLFHILEENYEYKPNYAHGWLMLYLKKLSEYVNGEERGKNIWISMEKIIDKIAQYKPDDLPAIINYLTDIWLKGAYIGDITTIYNAYQFIVNSTQKKLVKKLSRKLYKQLKEANPQVKDINWV